MDAAELFARVRFRRREPAEALRPYLEHYWLIDWDLPQPYASHVVPHPSVNIVFQRFGDRDPFAEVSGIGLELFTQKLEGGAGSAASSSGRVASAPSSRTTRCPTGPAAGSASPRP